MPAHELQHAQPPTPEPPIPQPLPAISLVAVPGRRRRTLEIAREIERRGFSGIYMPSRYGNMAQCTGLALATERIRFGTAIAHGTTHERLGITPGKPLADTRAFVEKLKSYDGTGALPPIILAALRKRMVALAAEIADGVLFANASLSHLAESLAVVPPAKRGDTDFLIGNMLPVCITDDEGAALALHRRRLVRYVLLPNYRNYWKEAGYGEEMSAIEHALAESRRDDIPRYLTDRWIADSTLYGPAAKVRDRLAAWYAAGLDTPVLVPNSVNGNQLTALEEIFAAFAH